MLKLLSRHKYLLCRNKDVFPAAHSYITLVLLNFLAKSGVEFLK